MALFKVFRGNSSDLPATIHDGYMYLTVDDGKVYIDTDQTRIAVNPSLTASDIAYNDSTVAIILSSLLGSSASIEVNTTSYWSTYSEASKNKTFYVYLDGYTIDGHNVPRIKLGDGNAYVADLPFLDEKMANHIDDSNIHTSLAEKAFWGTKLTCSEADIASNERVIFTNLTFGV